MIKTQIHAAMAVMTAMTLSGCDMMTASEPAIDIPEVEAGDISQSTMVDITRELSADEFEGRMPGTIGEELTVALLTEKFEAAGLQPGNNGSWVQNVPLVEMTGKSFAPLTITNGETDLVYDFGSEWVGVTYREDAQTQLANSELVFVGYGINAPERGWNDYEGIDVTGKTVVMLVNDPDWETQGLTGTFNGRAMTYYGRWTYKYEEAARQGAAAALIVHDTEPASYGWNVVESSWSGPQAYAQRGENAPPLTIMNGWVQKDVAREILAAAGQDLDALSEAAKSEEFAAVELGFSASTSFQNDIRTFESQNVIGVLPGAARPDEYVIHTAHWDHLGRCKPAPDGDDICNGALDNATGTAGLVALAEAHAAAGATERSMVFLAVTAEESGLLGAAYYGANPVYPLAQTAGGINMDGLNIIGETRDVVVVGYGKSELEAYLARVAATQGRSVEPEPTPEAGYFFRSDHFALARPGVPMIYARGGENLVNGGPEAGAAAARDYRANRYHGPKDEYDPNWNWGGALQDLELYYSIGRTLANSTDWPNWYPDAEFRAARDASRPPSE